jgi:hypothetical protein
MYYNCDALGGCVMGINQKLSLILGGLAGIGGALGGAWYGLSHHGLTWTTLLIAGGGALGGFLGGYCWWRPKTKPKRVPHSN